MPSRSSFSVSTTKAGGTYQGASSSRNWVNTPGFRRLKRHELRPQPFTSTFTANSVVSGIRNIIVSGTSVPKFVDADSEGGAIPSSYVAVTSNVADRQARQRLLERLKDSKVNLGVLAAERAKTANMVYSAANTLYRSITTLRKGDFIGAAAILGIQRKKVPGAPKGATVYEQWLALQFGWLPFLSDVKGSAEALAKIVNDSRVAFRVTGSASDFSVREYKQSARLVVESDRTSVRYKCLAFVDNAQLSQLNSIGFLNPLEVAWELVPFSFLVDYFYPIGNYLSVFNASMGFSIGYVTASTKVEGTRYVVCKNMPERNNQGLDVGYRGGYSFCNYTSVSRRLVSLPSPPIPAFNDDPVSVTRALNMIALLATTTSGRNSYR